jgi:transposase-like protein
VCGKGPFGLSPSSISRRFIRASARRLQELLERRLDCYHFVALILDGKSFVEDEMLIALLSACNAQAGGITLRGEKVILGFLQTGTGNERVCAAFLRSLMERGLRGERGLLSVIDGGQRPP